MAALPERHRAQLARRRPAGPRAGRPPRPRPARCRARPRRRRPATALTRPAELGRARPSGWSGRTCGVAASAMVPSSAAAASERERARPAPRGRRRCPGARACGGRSSALGRAIGRRSESRSRSACSADRWTSVRRMYGEPASTKANPSQGGDAKSRDPLGRPGYRKGCSARAGAIYDTAYRIDGGLALPGAASAATRPPAIFAWPSTRPPRRPTSPRPLPGATS